MAECSFPICEFGFLGVVNTIKLNSKGLPQHRELINCLVLAKGRDEVDHRVLVKQQLSLSSAVQFLPICPLLFHCISSSLGWLLS